MRNRNNISLTVFLTLFVGIFIAMPFVSSCGKGTTVSPGTQNIQYQVVNLSPNRGPLSLFVDFKSTVVTQTFYYPSPSGYFSLSDITPPFQIRPAANTLVNGVPVTTSPIFTLNNTLAPNTKYTLYVTGLYNSPPDTVSYVFTVDTAPLPALGRGKIRFLNASPRTALPGLSLTANGTKAFDSLKYQDLSKYIELPAGNYNFQLFPTGSSTNILQTIQNYTIQDGRLYTVYCYGLAGNVDSLAFGANVLINK